MSACKDGLGVSNNNGYLVGWCKRTRQTTGKHRIALQEKLNRILEKGEVCRHKCNNRRCINPDHLQVGSPTDNNIDKLKDHGNKAYLCPEVVRSIQAMITDGKTNKEIYDVYDITKYQMYDLRHKRSWVCLS